MQEVRHLLVPLLLERTGEIKQSNLGQSIQKKSDRSQAALKMFHNTMNLSVQLICTCIALAEGQEKVEGKKEEQVG